MNEKRIELPTGGFAWITMRPTHGQMKTIKRYQLRLYRFLDPQTLFVRADLTPDDRELFENIYSDNETVQVQTYVTRWDGVKSPNGDELSFPAGIDDLDEVDLKALVEAISTALIEVQADPNAKRPSGSSQRRASGRKTPTSISRSRKS